MSNRRFIGPLSQSDASGTFLRRMRLATRCSSQADGTSDAAFLFPANGRGSASAVRWLWTISEQFFAEHHALPTPAMRTREQF